MTKSTDEVDQAPLGDYSSKTFDRLFKEYQICSDQVSRLEKNVWQTAALLGVGSIVGLVSLASEYTSASTPFEVILAASIFAIVVSFVWLRFAKRWWSIQSVKLERMSEIDRVIGFRQNVLIDERNSEALGHKLYLRKKSRFPKSLWIRLLHSIPDDVKTIESGRSVRNYEYRGIRPVGELLIITNTLLWVSFLLHSAWVRSKLICTVAALTIFLVMGVWYWRKP